MKQFFISAVGAMLQLGKNGKKLISGPSGISVYESDGITLSNLQIADPIMPSNAVTLSYLQTFMTTPDYVVYGEMWITGPGYESINVTGTTPVDGKIYIVTYVQPSAMTQYVKNELYRYYVETNSYIAITLQDGIKISSANMLEDGYNQAVLDGYDVNAIKLKNATLYIYEIAGNIWNEGIGPNLSGYHVTKSFTMLYNNVTGPNTPTATGLFIPNGAIVKEIIIDVTTPFTTVDSLDPVDVYLGTFAYPTLFLTGDESDLSEIDFNIHRVKYLTINETIDIELVELALTFHTTDTMLTSGSVTMYIEYILG